MRFGDLQQGVTRYQEIPKDDFVTLINYESPPPQPLICKTCGEQFGLLPWGWSDIALELKLGHADKEYTLMGYCSTHNPYGKEEEAEELGNDDIEEE